MTGTPEHVAVIGAGIVGSATALALQRDGHRVTLVERDAPGKGTSFGNSGFIHTGGNIPLASPGIVGAAAKMMFDEEAPLVIRLRHLPRLAPWIWKFARRSRPDAFMEDAQALGQIAGRAVPAWRKLSTEAGADEYFGARGELFLYRSREKFEASRPEFELRRELGSRIDEVSVDEIRQMEPGIARDVQHGWYLADSTYTNSPYKLTRHLAQQVLANGGALEKMEVARIQIVGDEVSLRDRSGAEVRADRVVLAAGAFSKKLAAQVGARVPLETLRGYHVMLPAGSAPLKGPIMDAEKKFGVVPMQEGIRVAGMLEMANLGRAPSRGRADVLHRLAQRLLPDLPGLEAEESRWLGHRPGIPDSRPVIGPAPRTDRVLLAFGHGTIGLTLAAITGEIIADMVAGRPPAFDIGAFAPTRF